MSLILLLLLLLLLLLIVIISPIHGIYQSTMKISSMGLEYQPKDNMQLISSRTIKTKILCSAACNQLSSCRLFDYDLASKRCRLFEGDSTTGSIISSSSPTSFVGTVSISSSLYVPTHNQACQACEQTRYEICVSNTNTCQCPTHTYWNGQICALQLFVNETCLQADTCRSDLNLTCILGCSGNSAKCSKTNFSASSIGAGTTFAGRCNGSLPTNDTVISDPADVMLGPNNTIYVSDSSGILYVFNLNSRIGRVVRTFPDWPAFLFFDKATSNIYVTVTSTNLVYILPANKTIPPNGISSSTCSTKWVYSPTGIVVDSAGNAYISSWDCNQVMKWAPNAANGTVVAGSLLGTLGSNSVSLNGPHALALDEVNSFLYVADRWNDRIQRFLLGGSGIGVTVAGGNGGGSAANQLSNPSDVFLSRLDGSLYIADSYNNRVQKWAVNATVGITVAGSPTGAAGSTAYLMNRAYALAVDDEEKYLYVSDSYNNRIQRFSL